MKPVFSLYRSMNRFLVVVSMLFVISVSVHAETFKPGQNIFVAYPAANIKDDAFIIGEVVKVMPNGDYRISVIEYIEGHDYGLSCVPMVKQESNSSDGVWQIWTDTTKLETEKLDYVVPKANALDLGYGKTHFIERNNLYIVFGRWKSDAPMLNVERLTQAQSQAKANGLAEMNVAFEIAKLHRASYYGDYGRPLMPFEAIEPLTNALMHVAELFKDDKVLKSRWFAKKRDWQAISQSTKHYFAIEAIDKLVRDASNQFYQEGVEQAGDDKIAALQELLSTFERK
ncbi:hypothetical protein [Thiomicrorhabdus sediminis]|uniref:Uncharacterized protein n=1 Tax=Thiomicrorhabdus sediminis TaxID=2580412 RepID=A0A4P9K5N9_9GAMM|nr:hypothetical protein [Thiomicrorhabdus sediminis]QCU90178.1 hypothetical protein FE785_05815 [Thiomicrorhabdus sediminis]